MAKSDKNPKYSVGSSEEIKRILERLTPRLKMSQIAVLEHALRAFEAHYDQHGERALIPPCYNETFVVYKIVLPSPSKLTISETRVATVITDANGFVLSINSAFTAMCGFTIENLRGQKPGVVLQRGPLTKEDKEVVREFRRAIADGKPLARDITNYDSDKKRYRVHIKMEPIFEGRALVGFKAEEHKVE